MNLEIIKTYIVEYYPDTYLAYNIQHNRYNNEEEIREKCEDFFYCDKLGWCDCGNSNTAKVTIKDYLQCLYDYRKDKSNNWIKNKHNLFEERFGVRSIYDNGLLLCLAYALDTTGLTEHGSGIGSAWLTEEGEIFLWLLNHNEEFQR